MKSFIDTICRKQRQKLRARVQIISDLHLEVGQQYLSFTFPARAPFLLLGGDIGRLIDYDGYLKFLQAQAARFQKVFLILGNHEFYGLDYSSGLEKAQQLSKEPTLSDTLVLLNRARWDDPDSALTVIGCTLWSHIPDDSCDLVEKKINDFKKIDGWTACKHNDTHVEEAEWLRNQVARTAADGHQLGDKRHIMVATHHAPCLRGTSRPADSGNAWTCAFATDLLGQHDWRAVQLWAFGHTHYTTDTLQDGIRLVANQRGYVLPGSSGSMDEGKNLRGGPHDFDPGRVYTL